MSRVLSKPKVAVALCYDYKGAPRVTAKGRGEVAEAIIRKAREAGVPLEDSPVLAEVLSTIELDGEIPESVFIAVAEVLSFILRANGKLGARGG